jgi:hypothetical protein
MSKPITIPSNGSSAANNLPAPAFDDQPSPIDRMSPQLVQQERRFYFIGRTKREILFTVPADVGKPGTFALKTHFLCVLCALCGEMLPPP